MQGPMGAWAAWRACQARGGALSSLPHSARKISAGLRSPFRNRCLVKVFPAVASSWSRKGGRSEGKSWRLSGVGEGDRHALWDDAFLQEQA